jgi:hypothetical protein
MLAATPSPDEALRQRAARPWRVVTILGSALVVVTFLSILGVAANAFGSIRYEMVALATATVITLPFVLGAAGIAMAGLRGQVRKAEVYRLLIAVATVICCLPVLGFGVLLVIVPPSFGHWTSFHVATLLAVWLLLMLRRLRRDEPPRLRPTHTAFLASVATAAICTLPHICPIRANHPLWLAGALLMLLGTAGQAKALTRRPWWDVAWQLVFCRLADLTFPPGCCPGCGYILYGLNEQRCPECGRAFTFEEIGVTPEAMGFGRVNSA